MQPAELMSKRKRRVARIRAPYAVHNVSDAHSFGSRRFFFGLQRAGSGDLPLRRIRLTAPAIRLELQAPGIEQPLAQHLISPLLDGERGRGR